MNSIVSKIILIVLWIPFANYINAQSDPEKGTRTIFLIRHGDYNSDDESDPEVGKELTALGIAQARLLSARLKSTGIDFASLNSSTMTRARQTAIIINESFPYLELQQNKLISECIPPTWREDIMIKESEKDLSECTDNLENAFEKYFIPSGNSENINDIIVCHGNVIRYFVMKVLKVNTLAWLQMSIGNCSLTVIRILPDGTMKLDSFSDSGHIPYNMQTFTGGENESKKLIIHPVRGR